MAKISFVNNDGYIELRGKFPKIMSLKQAIRFSGEKHEFVLAQLQSGSIVEDDGNSDTCALCLYAERIYDRCDEMVNSCLACPICHKAGEIDCKGTPYWDIQYDKWKDGSFRIPNVRKQVVFLKKLEKDYA